MLRSQLVAVPCTLTTRVLAARYPGLSSTAGSGAATANRCAAPMPLNTCGNGPLESSRRKSPNMVFACDGMIRSMVPSTTELSTCPTTTGNDEGVRAGATAHVIGSMDSTLTPAPPMESRIVDDGFVTVCRTAAPMDEATNCPMMAAQTSSTTATTSC